MKKWPSVPPRGEAKADPLDNAGDHVLKSDNRRVDPSNRVVDPFVSKTQTPRLAWYPGCCAFFVHANTPAGNPLVMPSG
jgi:hypothetical protein